MNEDITKTDGFANGMLVSSVAMYPVVRGAWDVADGVVEFFRRGKLSRHAPRVVSGAREFVSAVNEQLKGIDAELNRVGATEARQSIQKCRLEIEGRLQWFTVERIREFVKANKIQAWTLRSEMAGFLADPVREMVAEIRSGGTPKGSAKLDRQLTAVIREIISLAEKKLKADVAKEGEPNYFVRRSLIRTLIGVAIIVVPLVTALALV